MALRSINVANATITAVGVFGSITMEGFTPDSMFEFDEVAKTESRRGVDGITSHGLIYENLYLTFTLEPSSPTYKKLQIHDTAQSVAKAPIPIEFVIRLPAIGELILIPEAVLSNTSKFPNAQKTLQPVKFKFCMSTEPIIKPI